LVLKKKKSIDNVIRYILNQLRHRFNANGIAVLII